MLKHINCNLCGSGSYSVVYKTYSGDIETATKAYRLAGRAMDAPLRIVRCNDCGLVYSNPRPPVRSLICGYIKQIDSLYVEEEKGLRLSALPILKVLKRLNKGGRILDLGCATGFFLDEARKRGWDAYGVELSNWAVDYAKNRVKIKNVFHGVLKNAKYPDNFFDVVIIKDAIERLTDPKGTLVEIRRILKSDGILCVNTPNIDSIVTRVFRSRWWGVHQSHLYYFNRHTLYMMLEKTGFHPIKTRSHTRVFTLRYWLSRFKGYNETLYRMFAFLVEHNIVRNNLLSVNLGDQIQVYARKSRKLRYIDELEKAPPAKVKKDMKVVAVLPAYNAARTLRKTVEDIPEDSIDDIILVDDASKDGTVKVAKDLGIKVFSHKTNKGYGGNQKTCYKKALEESADIVVMVHPDYQYDPRIVPQLIEPIRSGRADAVFGSRMMKGGALEGGMPLWKHNANILLTALENIVFRTFLTEYHSGFRAYSARLLRRVKFEENSDGFIFDTEIIAQILLAGFKIEEVPIRTRYFDEASTIKLLPSVIYGLGILKTLFKYIIHTRTFFKFRQFR